MLWTSGSAHSKFLLLSFFLRLTQELLLSQSLFPPLRLPHPGHNAQSPLQPLRNTIDYMVFTPLRAGGQGSARALKPKSQAHCPAKGEKAGGKAQPTFRGLIPARKKRRSSSALAAAAALRNRTAQAAHPEKLTERARHQTTHQQPPPPPCPRKVFCLHIKIFCYFYIPRRAPPTNTQESRAPVSLCQAEIKSQRPRDRMFVAFVYSTSTIVADRGIRIYILCETAGVVRKLTLRLRRRRRRGEKVG